MVLTIGAFQSFGQIDLLCKEPSGHTDVIVYSIFGDRSLRSANDGVQQAATSILLFLVILVLGIVQVRFLERRVHYQGVS